MFHLSTIELETYKLLQQLSAIDVIASQFALAGGASLALQIGHRKSIDLYFFSINMFDIRELEIVLSSEPNLQFQLIGSNSRMFFCYINNIKCDFVHEPANLIEPFFEFDGIKCFSVKDIAAMKLHTVCGRGKKKDFFDIYALLQLYSWQTLLKWFEIKYDVAQLFFVWRSIIYFEDAENEPDITAIAPFTKSWDEIKKEIILTCR